MPKYLPLAQLVRPPAHHWMLGAGDIHIFPKKNVKIERFQIDRLFVPTYISKGSYTAE